MADSQKFVEDLFEAALAQPPEQRLAYLDQACPGSPEVRDLVKMLLLADEQAGDFLETPVLSSSDTFESEPTPTFEPGTTVAARFHIHRFIARGGMGDVYEAWDTQLRERVALKTIRPDFAHDPAVIDRFRREVKQARAISHPNVCRIHELFCDTSSSGNKVWFLSMEFLDGFTLSEYIRHTGPMNRPVAFELLNQIVSGLKAAHANGVIHRDLKTGNIMLVSGSPGSMRAVITDFGLAANVLRRDGEPSASAGQGTPEFMAPEQLTSGEVSALADQYALGVILCEMLTGSLPKRQEMISRRAQLQSKIAKAADPQWARVVLRCLEQKPEARFETLDEVVLPLKPRQSRKRVTFAFAAIAALAIATALWYHWQPAPPSTSLAVLPLVNRTGNPSLDYVGAGMTEALTDDLSRMPGLQVAAGSVAHRYQGAETDPRTAGAHMQVGSIVTGSIQSSSGQLQIPIELIEVRSGKQIWGQTYQGPTSGLADMQHEIAIDVAYHLRIRLGAETAAHLNQHYSTNSTAYDAYLKGRFQLAKRSPDGLRNAVANFQQALTSDPNYAPALAALADCYSLLAFYGLEPSIPLLKNAYNTSQEALQLDSTSPEAYTARAFARTLLNFDWEGAEADYRRAIELDPKYPLAHGWYALVLLTPQGRLAEARSQMQYAEAADPNSFLTIAGEAMLEQYAGNYDRSIRILEPHMHDMSQMEPAVQNLAVDYIAKHEPQRSIKILRIPPSSDFNAARVTILGVAYAYAGERAKGQETVKTVEQRLHGGQPIAYDAALLYTALNEHRKALKMLDYAFASREPDIIWANIDPLLIPLRREQKFRDLITEMNIQQFKRTTP